MSGHSKWAQIRRSKGVNDARRGQLFTRLGREIVVAVREGGSGDTNANARLRLAGGTAMMVYTVTENHNRTVAEVRNAFNRNGGNMGENGCVDWLFENKGVLEVEISDHDPDELSLEALELGADDVDDVTPDNETITIYTDPADLETIRKELEKKNYKVVKAETTMIAKTRVDITEEKVAHQVMRLVEKLEDLDDVQDVYTNADFPEAFATSYYGS
jgi:YebC/PmpR family DNA-binding regulatory protein